MPKGQWSFLHEWVIYDYIMTRSNEGTLRLKQIIKLGRLLGRPKWIKVDRTLPITGTAFPDIQGIKLKGENEFRPAEVKYTTSLFNYHRDLTYQDKFQQFVNQNGFILVASHDYLPADDLITIFPNIEVFEIEIEDFITFCRENFSRLLNRQIKSHTISRVWLMYQGPNFNRGDGNILSARESMIWCPTENLSGFDLAPGDRILFYKTTGISTQILQSKFINEGSIDNRWVLSEIYIAEVISRIFSRNEYLQYKRYEEPKQLWKIDPKQNGRWRWNRVFEFKRIKSFQAEKAMHELYGNTHSKNFALKALEAFCYGKSREITLKDYRNLLEVLV
jgi:hypothetical protein